MTAAQLQVDANDLESDREHEAALAGKLRSLAALAVPALVFWFVAYWVVAPHDPLAPVTLLMTSNLFMVMLEMLGLAVVAAGLAVAIRGPRSSTYGPLGVAVGLAALSIRGGNMDLLPICLPRATAPWPIHSLVFEFWLWVGLIAVGSVVGRWVDSWSTTDPDHLARHPRDADDDVVDSAAEMRRALLAIVGVTILAFVLVPVFAGGTRSAVLKGQVFFSVGAGFYVATVAVLTTIRLQSPLWIMLALVVVGSVAYVVGEPAFTREMVDHGTRLIIPGIARPTPMQFAALGTIGIWAGFLSSPGIIYVRNNVEVR